MSSDETTSQTKGDKEEIMGIPMMETLVKTCLMAIMPEHWPK
jgi:hypothetical protein